MEMTMRTNLKVPFAEKDEARSLGARWDVARKTWYVENVDNIAQFMRWMPAHLKSAPAASAGIVATGKRFFRTGCNCLPWSPCPSCVAKVAAAGWGAPA